MTTLTRTQTSLLFNALLANAIFSTLCGFLMASSPGMIVNWLGGGSAADIRSIGFGLLLFAGWLAYINVRQRITAIEAWAIVAGDGLWVLFSVVLLVAYRQAFSTLGMLLIADVAVIVALFAWFQARGIRRSAR